MPRLRFLVLLLGLLAMLPLRSVRADDGIFPPAPAAKSFIDFDGKGFLLNGKRTFIVSGSLHYPRVPRALWRDRLLRMKRAGFNTVQTYAFWNYHEPQEGKWDFTGEKDFDAFLKLVKSLGMYAVVRPGPYVCAEWDSGGYPVWLRFKPGIRVREDNAPFEAAVDKWFDKIMPIIATNQINRGGAVIMVQLENEHPQGWGKEMPNNYFKHLRDKALALGLEVPHFFSGLHHGSDPAGDRPWDSKGRTNPWYSTEFWPGWYSDYGPLNADDFRKFDRGTWKILAYGGNGYNYYMLHGGTNFAYWNNDEDASSYDYGAAIGQAGDLRPIYYRFKRAAYFARTFQDILENSENASDDFRNAASNARVHVTARKSPAGTILFLDNNGNEPLQTHVQGDDRALYPSTGSLAIPPGEILPIVMNYTLFPDVLLGLSAANTLGIIRQGDNATMVVYGTPGDNITIRYRAPNGSAAANISATVPDDTATTPNVMNGLINKHHIVVLVMNATMADHTWMLPIGGQDAFVYGPDYVGDVEENAGKPRLRVERYSGHAIAPLLYTAGEAKPQTLQWTDVQEPKFSAPTLTNWQARRGDSEAQPNYKDTDWKASDQPLPMGADGDISAYAWYRANLRADKAGKQSLYFTDAGDWITIFVNGKRQDSSKIAPRGDNPVPRILNVELKAGDNSLAVFAAHSGRQKRFGYLGPLDTVDVKGVSGPVMLYSAPLKSVDVKTWKWKAVRREDAGAEDFAAAKLDTGDWNNTAGNEDVFSKQKGFVWYRTTLEDVPGPHRRLHFESVDDNGTIYLNGKKLTHHEGWDAPFDVSLDSAWNENGPNVLAVLVENTDNTGGIMGETTLQTVPAGSDNPIKGWKMRGSPGDPDAATGWVGVNTAANWRVPAFYRAEFTTTPPAALGPHPILRVTTEGLSRGVVWLNGHNLGRYPEKVPVNGIYLPECWLKAGQNTLVIFDEEGHTPAKVKLVVEDAASRTVAEVK